MRQKCGYVIIKAKDAKAALTYTERIILQVLVDKVTAYRERHGMYALRCVVVESDWPEYEDVVRVVEKRLNEKPAAPQDALPARMGSVVGADSFRVESATSLVATPAVAADQ